MIPNCPLISEKLSLEEFGQTSAHSLYKVLTFTFSLEILTHFSVLLLLAYSTTLSYLRLPLLFYQANKSVVLERATTTIV